MAARLSERHSGPLLPTIDSASSSMKQLLVIGSLALFPVIPEGIARWWMNPANSSAEQPGLVYRRNAAGHPQFVREELPKLLEHSVRTLKCSTGSVSRLKREDGVSIHVAYFEWDGTSRQVNPLEAFKHLPEQCLGSIGMNLVKDYGNHTMIVEGVPLNFKHLLFKNAMGRPVHSFKAVSVTGATSLISDGSQGGFEEWRELRWKAAMLRFKPSRVSVIQGAVHDVISPNHAWSIFKENVLPDLVLETQPVS
jgi:hypothetical protein